MTGWPPSFDPDDVGLGHEMSSHGRDLPNFMLVGAPKCGTAAICAMLAQHPEIYFPERREQNFFSTDLDHPDAPDEASYRAAFAGRTERLRGEGTTWYLYSKEAPRRILEACGPIPIIVSLRRPADLTASLFEYRKYYGDHAFDTLPEALAAEAAHLDDVAAGRAKPRPLDIVRDVGRYHEGVKRYIDAFGAERVKVVLYEEFRAKPEGTVAELFDFLGVTRVPVENAVANPSMARRSQGLARLVKWRPASVRLAIAALPVGLRRAALAKVDRMNSKPAARASLPENLKAELDAYVAGDVAALGALIGRDLSGWLGPRRAAENV